VITLTRLNDLELTVNAELIESVEAYGQSSVIHLVTGNNISVKQSVNDVVARILDYRRSIQSGERKGGRYVIDDTGLVGDPAGVRLPSGRVFLGREDKKTDAA